MYKRQLLELIRVNLLYVNPQLTNKAREKGKKGKRLTIYLLSQNLFSGLIFLLIYGFAMFAMNFVKLPGFFTYYVALFGMLGLTQSIS
ncbi:ABC transporter, partial [Enterococcus faecium]